MIHTTRESAYRGETSKSLNLGIEHKVIALIEADSFPIKGIHAERNLKPLLQTYNELDTMNNELQDSMDNELQDSMNTWLGLSNIW